MYCVGIAEVITVVGYYIVVAASVVITVIAVMGYCIVVVSVVVCCVDDPVFVTNDVAVAVHLTVVLALHHLTSRKRARFPDAVLLGVLLRVMTHIWAGSVRVEIDIIIAALFGLGRLTRRAGPSGRWGAEI